MNLMNNLFFCKRLLKSNSMKNILFTISLLMIFSLIVKGQSQIVFDKEETLDYLIEFKHGDNSYKRLIFSRLSESYNTSLGDVEFTFSLKQKRQILKRAGKLDFKVEIKDFNLSGDIMYRNFNVGDPLIPGKVSFTLKWFRGKKLLDSYTFSDVSISDNMSVLVNMSVNDSLNASNYRITMANVLYDYNVQNKNLFNKQVQYIDQYYTENTKARSRLRYLTALNINRDHLILAENLNDLYKYRDTANNLISYVRNVRHKEFYKSLPINSNDPKGLKSKLNKINNISTELKNTCNDILDNLDQVYYERGMDMLSQRKPDRAEYFFDKSVEFNNTFAPAHLQLARIYYKKGLVDRSVDRIFEIRSMNPDQETKIQTVEFARGVYNDFLLDAGELNNIGDFDAAVNVLLRARDICTNFPEVQCRSNMDVEMSRAVNGKYNLILKDADLSIRNNNLIEAENIIKEALDYAQLNRSFIPNNDEAGKLLSDLYFVYIDKANGLSSKGNYRDAINELDEASRLCNSYNEIYCSDELNQSYLTARNGVYKAYLNDAEQNFRSGNNSNAENLMDKAITYRKKYNLQQETSEDRLFLDIKQAVYTDYIDEGRSLHESGNYKSALKKYESATEIERNYSVRKNSSLNSYIKASAIKLVFELTDEGTRKVGVNNLKDARNLYNEAKDISSKYNLGSESSINSALSELKGKIFQQECINAQNEYNGIYDDALKYIAEKKFVSAHNRINDALNFANQNTQCDIETGKARSKQDYIAPAVEYMQKINKTNRNIKNRNFKSAIIEYQNAEVYFKSENIKTFGLSHKVLFDFIRSGHTDLVVYSVGFYNHNEEFEKAIDLLKELSRRNARSKITKDVQTILAADLASKDYSENPGANYKSNIARYTGGDKFFKYFSKAYKKQWKRLK
jgi:tetratricopeptide (TPR) repeat protein